MATKNKRGTSARRQGDGTAQPAPSQPTQAQPVTPQTAPGQPAQPSGVVPNSPQQAQDSNTAAIRKGVYLSALIYVEGNQAPADDFNALSTSALKKNLSDFFASPHDGLTMTLKSVDVQNDVEADDGGPQDSGETAAAGTKKKSDKFQF